VDVNMGCPIDIVCHKGMGCGLLERPLRMEVRLYIIKIRT
jgi:tRNA-dihydrouridine synthase